jgi:hypothetical protein
LLSLNVDTLNDREMVVNSKEVTNDAELKADPNGKKEFVITSRVPHKELPSINDGEYYEFVIKTEKQLRIIGCYEPDRYYELIPGVIERKYFIDCRNAFYHWF